MKEESKGKFRDGLSELLNDLPDEVPGLEDTPNLPKIKTDTQSTQAVRAKAKAKKVMNSLLSFYLSEEIIEEHEYIKAKSEIDEYALSMLIRQMQNSETAISSLMDTIEEGDAPPRIFELLSELQRTLLDIIKSQTMYMIAIEENAKKLSRDIDVYQESTSTKTQKKQNSSQGLKARGTKELMKALQNSISEENIQDVEGD
jgi:hypothetical protein